MFSVGVSVTSIPVRSHIARAWASPPSNTITPLYVLGASNDAGPDDREVATLTEDDEHPRVLIFDPNDGTIRAIDRFGSIPRPGGSSTRATMSAIAFARGVADLVGGDGLYVIVPTAVGGRKIGDSADPGPWHPDGAGPAWQIGGSSADTTLPGSLYLAHTSGNFKTAVDAAMASQFPDHSATEPIFFGHVANENDAGTDAGGMYDAAARCITDIRAAYGAPNAPWVMCGGPPEWTYASVPNREEIAGVNALLAQTLPNVAYVTGYPGGQHPDQAIHYTNRGVRELGLGCVPALGVAQSRRTAPLEWVDWIDDLTNQPACYYSFYRGRADYTGPCLRLSNGSTEIDVGFDEHGIWDFSAALAHAAGGDAWIVGKYSHVTGAMTMTPEGSANALVVRGGEILMQGRRFAWGGDENGVQLIDTTNILTPAGALLAVGRMAASGTKIMASGPQNTLGLFMLSGSTGYAAGTSQEYLASETQEFEPDWVPNNGRGYNLHAAYVDAATGYSNKGVPIAPGDPVGFQYGAAGALCWGGRLGSTNRYSAGSHVALAAWDVAPTGADLQRVRDFCAAIASDLSP